MTGRRGAVAAGTQPAFPPPARVAELLPDLDQRPPSGLTITGGPEPWLLGFTSQVDNVGAGPLVISGERTTGSKTMLASQRVLLANGRWHAEREVARLRYTNAASHHHWHLLRVVSYELRSLDGSTLVRDRKSGFCLADHYGTAPRDFDRHARYLGTCGQYEPEATSILEGTSLGFTDRYPAFFHGQNLDITYVPAGTYVLVHRANPYLELYELRYENDAASVRIRLTWRGRTPSVRILRRCPATASC
jgi:hypothetical protein